ncbi:MAG TPA: tetratricopeptide repeat protein [Anaeromyxobacteraceae bacterium]|nr:tetratricopeptide repeat protein [Anaeromyxobacteraceae bacterium]
MKALRVIVAWAALCAPLSPDLAPLARAAGAESHGSRLPPFVHGEGRGEAGRQSADFLDLRRAISQLEDENVLEAQALVRPILEKRPNDRTVQMVAGLVRFYQQRYGDAVELLERSGLGTGSLDYLALARAARDLTKDHARAEGEHFVVSYPKGKDEVLVPYVLEALEAQRRALQQDLGWASAGKVTIEILNDTRELARLSTLSEEEIKTSGTIALCKFNKLMIVSPKALVKGYDWLDTAAHEYTHYVVTARTRNNTPIWLHEGIAKYSESRWRGRGGELSASSAGLLRDALRKKQLITFAQMHPSMAKLPSQEAAALAFAEVELAVQYLEEKGGAALMNRILDHVTDGVPAERAVAQALGVTYDAFLADWKRFMAARPMPEGAGHVEEKLRFKGDPRHGGAHSEWSEIPDEKARGFARLGEIFRERGRWAAARVEYGKAVARAGKGIAVLSDKFALASMMSGHDEEARQALTEALRRHPQYAALHLHLARLCVKQKAWPEAREHLLLANAQDPFDPEIHAGLAAVYEAQGAAELASREKRFAQLLAHD